MNTMVSQSVSTREISRRLDRVGAPQYALAHFSGISEGLLSSVLAGRKALSEPARNAIARTLDFFEALRAQSRGLPIDYGNVSALEPRWKEYKRAHSGNAKAETA